MKRAENLYGINSLQVKILMLQQGLTFEKLARRLKVSTAAVHHVVCGRRAGKKLAPRIARALGVQLDEILVKPRSSSETSQPHAA